MGFILAWEDNNDAEDGYKVYRSTSPMDPEALPTPIVTLPSGTVLYEDGDVVEDTTYYYRVGAFVGDFELVSDELQVVAEEVSYVVATRWRINITANYSGPYIAIKEMEYREVEDGPDLTGSGTASADASYSTYTPDKAFDNSTDALQTWVKDATSGWLEYNFGEAVVVREVMITGRRAGAEAQNPKSFAIQYYNPITEAWVTLQTYEDEPTWTALEQRTYFVQA